MSNSTFPFDAVHVQAYKSNPAIRLFGNRFSNDQTSMELLCEFLLVIKAKRELTLLNMLQLSPHTLNYWNGTMMNLSTHPKLG
jgi:hypothetical protein